LKGFLVYFDERPEKTHNLGSPVEKAAEIEPGFNSWADAADRLAGYATLYRHPGVSEEPDLEDVEEAQDDAETILRQVVAYLPAEVHPVDD
jgi:hypothetical protein